jgi:hypothetical protein
MVPVQANHDTSEKKLFPGFTLPAGGRAEQDLDRAIHVLFMQPFVPPFVSKLLIQHLKPAIPVPIMSVVWRRFLLITVPEFAVI